MAACCWKAAVAISRDPGGEAPPSLVQVANDATATEKRAMTTRSKRINCYSVQNVQLNSDQNSEIDSACKGGARNTMYSATTDIVGR